MNKKAWILIILLEVAAIFGYTYGCWAEPWLKVSHPDEYTQYKEIVKVLEEKGYDKLPELVDIVNEYKTTAEAETKEEYDEHYVKLVQMLDEAGIRLQEEEQ